MASGSESDDGGGGAAAVPLTVAAIRAMIADESANERASSAAAMEELRDEAKSLAAKLAESERVIAFQAREAAAGKAAKAEKPAARYVRYGKDGRGLDNPWPSRDLNAPDVNVPHNFDVSQDPVFKRCVGKHRCFAYEYRSLSAVGSYLHDFAEELGPLLDMLSADEHREWREELTNSIGGIQDLVASRFNYVSEFVKPDAERDDIELSFLQSKLYPADGPAGPSSSLAKFRAEYKTRLQFATDKQYANRAATAALSEFKPTTPQRDKPPPRDKPTLPHGQIPKKKG
jgi:hypothetical protein